MYVVPDGCKSARRDEKRLIYGRVSKPVKKERLPVRKGSPKEDDDNNDDGDAATAWPGTGILTF